MAQEGRATLLSTQWDAAEAIFAGIRVRPAGFSEGTARRAFPGHWDLISKTLLLLSAF